MYSIGPTLAAELTGLLIFFNQKKAMLRKTDQLFHHID
jgi:hypothetical protein